jgi:hypothetical protein
VNYEKKLKTIINSDTTPFYDIDILIKYFPELKESEDERIRKELIRFIENWKNPNNLGRPQDYPMFTKNEEQCNKYITWLEKQGEQKDIINNKSDFVDLGLPSGTLWAKCNLGAEKETDFGLYYQWGDVKGYKSVGKHQFSWEEYKFGSWDDLTKYNENDRKLILDNEDDPVFVATNGKFKMPTKEQMQELINNTNHKWINVDGINGMKFISKKDSTKYIFIPAAGSCDYGDHTDVGSWGCVWSASCSESYAFSAWIMTFYAGDVCMYSSNRYYGYSMRGVK